MRALVLNVPVTFVPGSVHCSSALCLSLISSNIFPKTFLQTFFPFLNNCTFLVTPGGQGQWSAVYNSGQILQSFPHEGVGQAHRHGAVCWIFLLLWSLHS